MISYELAKKLKDAGFPQEPFWVGDDVACWGGSWYLLVKEEACAMPVFADPDQYKDGTERGDNIVKQPTLSELIEACGEDFKKLWRHSNGTWSAHTGTKTNRDAWERTGATPEEAVANLLISLYNQGHGRKDTDSKLN